MKALVGSWDTRPHALIAEITALRTKVAELKEELAHVRAENEMLRDVGGGHDLTDLPSEEVLAASA